MEAQLAFSEAQNASNLEMQHLLKTRAGAPLPQHLQLCIKFAHLDSRLDVIAPASADTLAGQERLRAAEAVCQRTQAALYSTLKQAEEAKKDGSRLLHQRSSLASRLQDAKLALLEARYAPLCGWHAEVVHSIV